MSNNDLDDARIQLAILNMQGEVKAKVEADLFRYYRNLGSIILAVLASVGVFIGWPAVQRMVGGEIARQVERPVAQARNTAERANDIAENALARLEERQKSLQESIGRADSKFEIMHARYGKTSADLDSIDEAIKEIRKIVDFVKIQIPAQQSADGGTAKSETESLIKELVGQTNLLAEQVANFSRNEAEKGKLAEINEKLTEISLKQVNATDAAQTPDSLRANSIVYVQFAGGQREKAVSMSAALKEKGWTVPGEERIATAAGKHEVRFFRASDAGAAKLLADEANAAIAAAGFRTTQPVTARQVNLSSLPAPGILEIWLEIPPN